MQMCTTVSTGIEASSTSSRPRQLADGEILIRHLVARLDLISARCRRCRKETRIYRGFSATIRLSLCGCGTKHMAARCYDAGANVL